MSVPVPKEISLVLFYSPEGEMGLEDRREISKWGEDVGLFGGTHKPCDATPEDTLRRELREELGLKDLEFAHYRTYDHFNPLYGKTVRRHIYLAHIPVNFTQLPHSEGKPIIRRFDNISGLKFIPGAGFDELLQDIYRDLKAQGKTI